MNSTFQRHTAKKMRCAIPVFSPQKMRQRRCCLSTIERGHPRHNRNETIGPHGKFEEEYSRALVDPLAFWSDHARDLKWFKFPERILETDPVTKLSRWFVDGEINISYNSLDVHVQDGRGDQVALIYDSPVTNYTKRFLTYKDLLDQVSAFAGVLVREMGIQKGDRVIIYMPMVPEAVISMLACARIGAVHSVVFGGFASKELATRINDCEPKLIITASCGVEPRGRIIPYKPIVDQALEISNHKVLKCIIVQRDNVERCNLVLGRDFDYNDLMANDKSATPHDAVPLLSTDPNYILYTSGTTGNPKGILRDTGGHATALKWSMGAFYNTNAGETFWTPSDIGWVVGHSYGVYGPLLQGCSTILYEGKPVGTPDAGAFWRVVQEHNVKTLFASPTAFRFIKQHDPDGSLPKLYNLNSLQSVFLAGERCDPDTLKWIEDVLDVPAIDHWWQTELGWPGIGNQLGLGYINSRHGACASVVCGYNLAILNNDGEEQSAGTLGNLVLKLPLPPGTLSTLYKNTEKFIETYLKPNPGFYTTGDAGFIDDDGYVHIMGRCDDVINTAGHRLSTGAIEETLLDHPDVAECAVIGVHDELKGEVAIGFVTLISGSKIQEHILCKELVQRVRDSIGPVAAFKKVRVVNALPKTRSGKILRGTMKKIANGEPYSITPTIEDPNIFEYLAPEIKSLVSSK